MMSELQYNQILDSIKGYLNGCPEALIISTIDQCLERYVEDAGNLFYDYGPIFELNDTGVYEVIAPCGGRVLRIAKVTNRYGEVPRQLWTEVDFEGFKCVKFYDKHDARAGLVIRVEWMPTADTDEMPEQWFADNRRAICDSVLATLLAQEGKPWAAPSLAMYYLTEHKKNLANAIFKVKAEGKPGGQLTCFDPDCSFAGAVF